MINITTLKHYVKQIRDFNLSLGLTEAETKKQIVSVIDKSIMQGGKNKVNSKLIRFLKKTRYLYLADEDKQILSKTA